MSPLVHEEVGTLIKYFSAVFKQASIQSAVPFRVLVLRDLPAAVPRVYLAHL